ncbi:MAG: hypothetical protein U0V70_18060 [Terriglobia bacterium]
MTTLIIRFLVGFLLGGILFLCLSFIWGIPLGIGGGLPFVIGVLSMIYGEKFILAFVRLLSNWPT